MTAAVWLAGIKSGAWGRWGVVLDLWGSQRHTGYARPICGKTKSVAPRC